MKKITDPRIAFYLKHREQIEQWAAIAEDVPELADRFLRSMESDFRELARRLNVRRWLPHDESHPKYFLLEESWLASNSEEARVAIGLEWRRRDVTFYGNAPYVGVWVNLRREGSRELYELISKRIAGLRPRNAFSYSKWSPAYMHVRPEVSDPYWEDLTDYRAKLIDEIQNTWWLFRDTVSETVSSHKE